MRSRRPARLTRMILNGFLSGNEPLTGDLLEELASTSKAPGKPIGMLLLEGGGKTVAVAVILLERLAVILHHVGRIGRSGVDELVDTTLGEATGADHIGNMDSLHPVEPLQLDSGLNGYLNFVNDHGVVRTNTV